MKNTSSNIDWQKAGIAGIIGTVLFDLVGLAFTGTWWDIPGVLASAVGVPFPIALLMHYGNGVALAVIYAALAPSLFGPAWFRAIAFTTLETVMLVWFLLFPLLGLGIAGLKGGWLFPILSMTRHWAYAIPLLLMVWPAAGRVPATSGATLLDRG
ncbi:hypothetical protein [Luteolibacter marinus]|uniref:hypothetical protein n=1 Tax=Luteolibacter marinus TaxID=2776705 RepID=UPI001868B3BF|nr:hypothetical protein [Luteolibacter marinus]